MTLYYCILCPKTFETPTGALDHFRERRHGWSAEWKHGFEGRAAEDAKRQKDGRRKKAGKSKEDRKV